MNRQTKFSTASLAAITLIVAISIAHAATSTSPASAPTSQPENPLRAIYNDNARLEAELADLSRQIGTLNVEIARIQASIVNQQNVEQTNQKWIDTHLPK